VTDVHWKMEARMRKQHGPGLLLDGWTEDDTGWWHHPREDTPLTVVEAHLRQTSWDITAGRWYCFVALGLLTSLYGIIILIANWNYICAYLNF